MRYVPFGRCEFAAPDNDAAAHWLHLRKVMPISGIQREDWRSPAGLGDSGPMTSFDDRRKGFEAKFVADQDMMFRITARRNRLVAQWAAERMKLTPAETDAYAKAVVQADFEEAGDEDVIRKLLGDLTAAGIDVEEAEVRRALDEQQVEARRQLIESR